MLGEVERVVILGVKLLAAAIPSDLAQLQVGREVDQRLALRQVGGVEFGQP